MRHLSAVLSRGIALIILGANIFLVRQSVLAANETLTELAALRSATERLTEIGIARPLGTYQEVQVVVGNVWAGNSNIVRTHGWVSGKGTNMVAVGWNGLAYPVVSAGPPADLKADVLATLASDKKYVDAALVQEAKLGEKMNRQAEAQGAKPSVRIPSIRRDGATPEYNSVSHTNMFPLRAALLLNAGEENLARELWAQWFAGRSNETTNDPFLLLATHWAWSLFDRAVCAHMRGDERTALQDARLLTRVRPLLEEEIRKRRFTHQLNGAIVSGNEFLDFLQPLPELLRDQERRARVGQNEIMSPDALRANMPDQRQRIARLVAQLDQVWTQQSGQPGGLELNWETTLKALAREGEPAVEALLDAAESDQRLTRSVSFHRDFFRHRHFLSAREAALHVLGEILRVRFESGTEYRAYWNAQKNFSPLDRWYRTLMDDTAGRKSWMQAADNILSRQDGTNTYCWRCAPAPTSTNGYRHAGAALHTKANPSVSELLTRRALGLAPTNYASSEDCWTFNDAATLALMLSEWDTNAAVSTLGLVIRQCPALHARRASWTTGCSVVTAQFARLASQMANLGDATGLDLYADWIGDRSLRDIEDGLSATLSPLARFANHPSIRAASEKLFQPERGDWFKAYRDIVNSQLVRNESFRALVLNGLNDRAEAGTITVSTNNSYTVITKTGSRDSMLKPGVMAEPDKSLSFRVCDDIASRLPHIEGLTEFELYWPEEKRDAALNEIRKFLQHPPPSMRMRATGRSFSLDEP